MVPKNKTRLNMKPKVLSGWGDDLHKISRVKVAMTRCQYGLLIIHSEINMSAIEKNTTHNTQGLVDLVSDMFENVESNGFKILRIV